MNKERLERLNELESKYEILECGEVVNKKSGKKINPYFDRGGYMVTRLSLNGKGYQYKVHELSAYKAGLDILNKTINHIDGKKTNNHLSNLEAVTLSDNIKHAAATGLQSVRGEKQWYAKLTTDQVQEIRRMYATGNYLMREIAAIFKVSRSNISYIVGNKSWNHVDKVS